MSDKNEIDVEVLITNVQNRPVIWDKNLVEYKDKILTKNAWEEIFAEMNADFNNLDEKKKTEFGM